MKLKKDPLDRDPLAWLVRCSQGDVEKTRYLTEVEPNHAEITAAYPIDYISIIPLYQRVLWNDEACWHDLLGRSHTCTLTIENNRNKMTCRVCNVTQYGPVGKHFEAVKAEK